MLKLLWSDAYKMYIKKWFKNKNCKLNSLDLKKNILCFKYCSVKNESKLQIKIAKRQLNYNNFIWFDSQMLEKVFKAVFKKQVELINLADIYGLFSFELFKKQKALFNSLLFRVMALNKLLKSFKTLSIKNNLILRLISNKKVKNLFIKLLKLAKININKFYAYKVKLIKSTWILNNKLKFLNFFTFEDKVLQKLTTLVLEPLVEVKGDLHNFFKHHKSPKQTIYYLSLSLKMLNKFFFNSYNKFKIKSKIILNVGIKNFFCSINQNWILNNLFLYSKWVVLINAWLKSSTLNKKVFILKTSSTVHKYIVCFILINFILNGLEEVIMHFKSTLIKSKKIKTITKLRYWNKMNIAFYVRYVDSFVFLLKSKYIIYNYIFFFIINFLKVRGLKLNEKKTKLLKLKNERIQLNFLNYAWEIKLPKFYNANANFKEIFRYSGKQKMFDLIVKIKAIFKKLKNWDVYLLINQLNLTLKSWFNYHYICVNFFYHKNIIKSVIYRLIWKWVSQKHMFWGKKAIATVYFLTVKTSIPFLKRKSYIKFKNVKWVFKKKIRCKNKKKTNYLDITNTLKLISNKYFILPKHLLVVHGYYCDYMKLIAFNTNFVFN